jgi:hypothetical protein
VDSVTDHALPKTLPADKPTQPRLLFILVGLTLGIATDRFILATQQLPDIVQQPEETQATVQSAFSRVGDRIVVSEASPLRMLLTVAAPTTKEVARTLVVPATVEADPSHTVR